MMVNTTTHLVYIKGYSIFIDAVTFLYSYLKLRKQGVKNNNSESLFEKPLSGVPKGSIIGPIPFNVFSNDLLIFITEAKLTYFLMITQSSQKARISKHC